jgi:hypothetical protein
MRHPSNCHTILRHTKMKSGLVFVLLLVIVFTLSFQNVTARVKDSGGGSCAGCVIVFRVVEQVIEYKEPNVEKALNYVCSLLPAKFSSVCELIVKVEA